MEIRIARQEDLPQINDIYNQAVRQRFCTAHLNPLDMDKREHWFSVHKSSLHPVYVALQGDTIVGWVSLGPYREDREALAHVAEVSFFVEEKKKGRGLGSKLLDHAIHMAPDFGFTVLIAILLNRNPASLGLLKKFGFDEWGRMPGIARIDDQVDDHLYYGLKL